MKETIKIGITFEYDPEENNNIPARIFLFQMLNRLDYEYPIKELEYKGKKLEIKTKNDLKNLKLRKKDCLI